jgi:hypothetical protein
VGNTNQEYEDYQAAVGTEYIDLMALTTAADVAYITAMANAEEPRQVAKATAAETLTTAESTATATREVTGADAALTGKR